MEITKACIMGSRKVELNGKKLNKLVLGAIILTDDDTFAETGMEILMGSTLIIDGLFFAKRYEAPQYIAGSELSTVMYHLGELTPDDLVEVNAKS